MLVKRIIGLEGEKVTYEKSGMMGTTRVERIIPPGHIWIQGDNTVIFFTSNLSHSLFKSIQ